MELCGRHRGCLGVFSSPQRGALRSVCLSRTYMVARQDWACAGSCRLWPWPCGSWSFRGGVVPDVGSLRLGALRGAELGPAASRGSVLSRVSLALHGTSEPQAQPQVGGPHHGARADPGQQGHGVLLWSSLTTPCVWGVVAWSPHAGQQGEGWAEPLSRVVEERGVVGGGQAARGAGQGPALGADSGPLQSERGAA